MSISQIEIKNIKGISEKCFNVNLLEYKPNLLVAPNGFGKSSIATAFSSMNKNRIDLMDKNYHKGNESLVPELSITVSGQKLTANPVKNEIRQQFDVLVINSGLISKAKKHFKGAVSSDLQISPILICKTPNKVEFSYKIADSREKFGNNGKILPNISSLLKSEKLLNIINNIDLSKFKTKQKTALSSIISRINEQEGSAKVISQWVFENCTAELQEISVINELIERISTLDYEGNKVAGFLVAYQIIDLYITDPVTFKGALVWLNYTFIKKNYTDLLSTFRSSEWQWAKVVEDKKNKELKVIFPIAHQLSNGQRDIITLIVNLHKTLYFGSKKPLILVIDEVFDYLDDANLVAFQYYVTSIIEEYKQCNQIIYPIILTHLDPGVFFDFCFNKHKIQINYLQAKPSGKSKNTLRLIEARDTQEQIKDSLEMSWFHFHTDSCVITEDKWPNTLVAEWKDSKVFHAYTENELKRYLAGKNYDPLAICFFVRIAVEKLGYNLLPDDEKKETFLRTKKTVNKMDYVENLGIEFPEICYLLGIIYNTNLHWNQGRDYLSPLVTKLNHPTIKQLILEVTNLIS